MSEAAEYRIKRLQMRSMRRGIKEMDIILSAYAAQNLEGMEPAQLDRYEALLRENDQDLYDSSTKRLYRGFCNRDLIDDIAQTFQK